MAKSGVQQEQFIFETYLIEEENQQGMSYNTFIEFIRNETIKCLK